MPTLIFTQEQINKFFAKPDDDYEKEEHRHYFYQTCVKKCNEILVHADGLIPKTLLCVRRPNETPETQTYREQIWKAKTKPTFGKVFNSLQKIRRSSDWAIKYPDENDFGKIREDESLENYCEKEYPDFTSVTNWMFSICLRKMLTDPNAVVLVKPKYWDVELTEFIEPIAEIFDSCHVIDFVSEDYVVLENPEGCTYYATTGTGARASTKPQHGRSVSIINTQYFWRYNQIDSKGNFDLVEAIPHELGKLPAFQLKGVVIDQKNNRYLYESRVGVMIPELDEAAREYSDLQAAKVLHMYPERWEYTQNECGACKGSRVRPNPAWYDGCDCPQEVACATCNGTGYINAGPYSKIMVRPLNAMETGGANAQIPTPPAGFIEKDVAIIELMEKSVDGHLYNALAAVNMEFLGAVPLAESGVAKATDRDEANNTGHAIAEDLVSVMDNIYLFIAVYRYKGLYSIDDIPEMLPMINVPEKFDLLSAAYTVEELQKSTALNPITRNALEIDYAGKRFNTDPEIQDRVTMVLQLDPLSGISEADKMSRLANKGITQEAYVISSNISEYVQRAVDTEKNFKTMRLEDQKAVMKKYAAEQMAAEEKARQALIVPLGPGEDNFGGASEDGTEFDDSEPPTNGQQQPNSLEYANASA